MGVRLFRYFEKKNTVLLKIPSTMIFALIVVVTKMASMRSGPALLANTRTKDQLLVVLAAIKNKWANGVANVITLTRTKMTFVLIVQEIRKVVGLVRSVIPSIALIENPIIHLNAINVETTCLVDGIVSPKKEKLINVQNGTTPATTRGAIVAWIA